MKKYTIPRENIVITIVRNGRTIESKKENERKKENQTIQTSLDQWMK